MVYQTNSSSLEDQGCSSMDSLENQAPPSDEMENQSLPVRAAALESSHSTVSNSSKNSFEEVCSPCDSSEGCNTPTNSLRKGQSSSTTEESDSEVFGLDLVRTEMHLLLYDYIKDEIHSSGGLRDCHNKRSNTKST